MDGNGQSNGGLAPRAGRVAVVGLGAMGGRIARRIMAAGYRVVGHDLRREAVDGFLGDGGIGAESVEDVFACPVLLTSLPTTQAWRRMASEVILARLDSSLHKVVIDVGTSEPSDAARFGLAATSLGVDFLDAPVSGGPRGAEEGELLTFVGGPAEVFERWRHIVELFSGQITYCGPHGAGQAVKAVNQLSMGLTTAALVEAVALGVASGVTPELLDQALGGSSGWRAEFRRVARSVSNGGAEGLGVKFGQLDYILRHAGALNMQLPLTERLHDVGLHAENRIVEANRESPSYWYELTHEPTVDA